MALTFTVCERTDESGGYQRGSKKDSLTTTYRVDYLLEASDPADGNFDPRNVDVFDVLASNQLPIVNFSTYLTKGGLIIPYLVCTSKRATRDATRRSRWLVNTEWTTGQQNDTSEDQPETPPDNLTDFTPKVETSLGEREWVRYSDKDNKTCLTPTGNEFDSPFVERIATEQRRVTQYEASVSYQTLRTRYLSMNQASYRGEAARTWIVTGVEPANVQVLLSGGPTTAVQVTYTLEFTDRPDGWLESRALIDTHFLVIPGDFKTPFTDDVLRLNTSGKIDLAGHKLNDQSAVPEYDQWRMQNEIDFGFLQA